MNMQTFELPLPVAPAKQTQTSIVIPARLKVDSILTKDRKRISVRVIADETVTDPIPCDWFVIAAPMVAGCNVVRPPDCRGGAMGYWVTALCLP